MKVIKFEGKDKAVVPGIERAALWDYPKDDIPVSRHIRQLQELEIEIRYCKTRYRDLFHKLKAVKHQIHKQYDNLIDRIWNDQKAGTFFPSGQPFEPHQVVKHPNLVLWDGLTVFTEMIAQETSNGPSHMALGDGTSDPSFGDQSLENEVARIPLDTLGDINSDGTVLKMTGAFPTGIPTTTVSELAAFDDDTLGNMIYRTVIKNAEDMLAHIQNRTIVQASHSIEFTAVENELD